MMVTPSLHTQQQIEQGIAILKRGGIVVFPTDTVYGLGAGLDFPEAIERIYRIKQRPLDMALPLLLAGTEQVSEVAIDVPELVWSLACEFWPGGLTLVLKRSKAVPDIVTAGGPTVAVRVPDHPVPLALIRGLGTPVVGTSANVSGQPSMVTAREVSVQLDDRVDLIIEDDSRLGGKESSIVDLTGKTPVLLREGAISREQLGRYLA